MKRLKRLYWPIMAAVSALDIALFISLARMTDTEPEPSTAYCTCGDDTNELATVQQEIDAALKQ